MIITIIFLSDGIKSVLGIAALADSGGQTSGATCPLVLRARPSVHGPLCTSEGCLAESRSDLHIPAGPAWTDRTAGAEEASHSAWPPSPASSSPCPSQASRLPFSAAWSECKGKAQEINARAPLFPPVVAAVGCEEIVTFRCSLRDAVILDFRCKKKKISNVW